MQQGGLSPFYLPVTGSGCILTDRSSIARECTRLRVPDNVTVHFNQYSISDRTKRIRDAKAEAQKEIEEYRKQKEEEYKKFEAEVRCSSWKCKIALQLCMRSVVTDCVVNSSTRADSRRPKKMPTRRLRRSSRRSWPLARNRVTRLSRTLSRRRLM